VILGSRTDKTTKGITLERWSGIWHVTSTFQGIMSGVQENSLLWIHSPCFSGRYLEKFVVEFVWTIQEVSGMNLHRPAAFTIGGCVLRNLEAFRRNL
jgi:hypothetical protein